MSETCIHHLWSLAIFAGIWLFLGGIAFLLGYIFLKEEGEKIKFWNTVFIIGLGLLSLIFIGEDIQDTYQDEYQRRSGKTTKSITLSAGVFTGFFCYQKPAYHLTFYIK